MRNGRGSWPGARFNAESDTQYAGALLAPGDPQYLNPVSFGGYFKPVKKLLEMNNVAVS